MTTSVDSTVQGVPGTASCVQTSTKATFPGFKHPLDPLTPDEMVAVSLAVRKYTAAKTPIKAIRFITTSLLPPPKKDVLAFLGIPLSTGIKPEPVPEITRQAEVDFIDVVTGDSFNTIVALQNGVWEVETLEKLPDGVQPQISVEELFMCEQIVREDETVIRLAKEVGVEAHQIFADGWALGYDERFPKNGRIQQAIVFARTGEHENLYAHPLDFIPVVDIMAKKVIHIDWPPQFARKSDSTSSESSLDFATVGKEATLKKPTTAPPPLDGSTFDKPARNRIPPPLESQDFLPDLIEKSNPDFKIRSDVKPLHVVQPDGVSFKMDGHELEWQKWKMHIAFHHREGIVLSTVTYNDEGTIRPLFYRLSLSEMVVPYGAPEHPHPRKHAFDAGEYGMGTMANELALGCDCLGQIHYLPGAFVKHDGTAFVIKNAICIHEEDHGLLWKHTDYRVGGRSHAVRSRRLVVSMICTLANYEYVLNYYFYQDGSAELEIRLSGMLQVYPNPEGEPTPFGAVVAPGISAQYHQHLFSVRLDSMIDGLKNTVVETDVLQLDAPTGSLHNFAGNGFFTRETPIAKQKDGARNYDGEKDRRWIITNPDHQHPASKKDVGYAIGMKGGICKSMAKPDSWVAKRAGFTQSDLWVVKDKEGPKGSRIWPSGKYVPGTRGEHQEEFITSWVQGDDNLIGEDLLVYMTVGATHIPRPEDWPVMPVELLHVSFKPCHFFSANPSMDVPGANDSHSTAAFQDGGSACCSNSD
ncbi:peroxisomal copper amine oxidase [Cristinia sonorae]|uniref:Amine oxidase n=1 Tax=Cristinia sonorae TaxID=1940300 RepID=A0A8K0UV38_9AGAR|nr:peroxisomal copper amine oxidase [Cristinia sonorae]